MDHPSVTFAGQPFVLPSPAILEAIERYMPLDRLQAGVAEPSPTPELYDLGFPKPPPMADRPRIGTWFYPYGMSRWSVYRGLMAASAVAAVGDQYQTNGPHNPLTFTMAANGVSLSSPMFPLPPQPLATGDYALDGLFLVTLVDERYFKRHQYFTQGLGDITLSWATGVEVLRSHLGITLESLGSVDSAYGTPEPDSALFGSCSSAAVLFDVLAANIGRHVVRKMDGTYKLQPHATARTTAEASRVVARGCWGGNSLVSSDLSTEDKFRSVRVPTFHILFPKWNPLVGFEAPSETKQQAPDLARYYRTFACVPSTFDLGEPYASMVAGAGKVTIFDEAKAVYDPQWHGQAMTASSNESALEDLCDRLMADYCDRVLLDIDESYPQLVAWSPDGLTDLLWTLTETESGGRATTLAVSRPVESGVLRFQHRVTSTTPADAANRWRVMSWSSPNATLRLQEWTGSAWADVSPTVEITACEVMGRTPITAAAGVTHRVDAFKVNGQWFFAIDQYATESIVGMVSVEEQNFSGQKNFWDTVRVGPESGDDFIILEPSGGSGGSAFSARIAAATTGSGAWLVASSSLGGGGSSLWLYCGSDSQIILSATPGGPTTQLASGGTPYSGFSGGIGANDTANCIAGFVVSVSPGPPPPPGPPPGVVTGSFGSLA